MWKEAAVVAAVVTVLGGLAVAVVNGFFGLIKDNPFGSGPTTGVVVTTAAGDPKQPDPTVRGMFDPSLFTNKDSGATGAEVKLSGEGFPPNAKVVLRFHTTQIGETRTNGEGKFSNVAVKVPSGYGQFAPQQFDFVASASPFTGQTPFMLTG